ALESAPHVTGASFAIVAAEALAYHEEWMKARPDVYGPDIRDRLRLGAFVSATQYVKAQRVRQLVRNEVDALLAHLDVLIAPATPIVAPPVGQTEVMVEGDRHDVRSSLIRFTRPFNLSGHPACSVRAGFSDNGLPVGLQIVAPRHRDDLVLQAAYAYEQARPWNDKWPREVPAFAG
ncbi:MAG: amidase, partial [Chloroflexi bacterium]|nr:amidase [Chloroflexota bacterium]